jgi:metal-responsive CopG/Arc/MetJ family transcriptional regulator
MDRAMRTLVDIPEPQVRALDELSRTERRSRAALIRQAVDEYLSKRRGSPDDDAFGLWGDRQVDGLIYQKKLRAEW